METKIEGKASEKDTGIALKFLYGAVGLSLVIVASGVFIWLIK